MATKIRLLTDVHLRMVSTRVILFHIFLTLYSNPMKTQQTNVQDLLLPNAPPTPGRALLLLTDSRLGPASNNSRIRMKVTTELWWIVCQNSARTAQ